MIGKLYSSEKKKWDRKYSRFIHFRLLYDVESPRTNSGRGLVYGKVYTRDGKLAVSATQEGVVRLTKGEQERRRKAQNDSKI
jgi:hypothetical protein